MTAAALCLSPAEARACGGMFCDGGPQPMPVDQTGEVILFTVNQGRVEAHIQIQYDPDTEASRFAWIVPVTALPEILVGSERLLLNVQNGTVPSYGFQSSREPCDYGGGDYGYGGGDYDDPCGNDSVGASGGGDGGYGSDGSAGPGTFGDPMEPEVEVLAQASVGAFDYVVLESQSVDDLMTWLSDNQYYQDPAAAPILQEYIDEGHLFVAFRLTQGAAVGEIHPIVIRYEGDEPCVPIRLTRIAARDDLEIRAFFLSDGRFAPTNYRHVVLNPVRLDWFQFAPDYKDAVSQALDGPEAEGHAFVTEYAGPSSVVSRDGTYSLAWDATPFAETTPAEVVSLLAQQDLFECVGTTCEAFHPLIEGLLAKYLPVPTGVDPDTFYGCVECFDELVDVDAWDAVGLAADIDERVVQPGEHAAALLETQGYLTRLYTTISPSEMTVDPLFHKNAELPTVDKRSLLALANTPCSGPITVDVGGGLTPMTVKEFQIWPAVAPESMPWARRVELLPPSGGPQVLLDNDDVIEQLIAEWNGTTRQTLRPEAVCEDSGGQGCGCTSGDEGRRGLLLGGFVLLGGLLRRVRRARRRR